MQNTTNKVHKYKKMLLSLGCSQSELATKLNISRQRVNDVINGRASFTETQLIVLCQTYNINLNWLLADVGSMFIPDEKELKKEGKGILQQLRESGVEPDEDGILRVFVPKLP